jgi:hypothetical protein
MTLQKIFTTTRMVINLQQDAHDTFQDALDSHPHNTQISYSAKQAEFKTWMISQSFADNISQSLVKRFTHFKEEKFVEGKERMMKERLLGMLR